MVCVKKTASAAAAVASAGLQSYNSSSTAGSASSSAAGASTAALVATNTTSTSSVSASNSGIKGFNYGAFFLDYSAKVQSDFEYEFKRAQELTNTTGWNSARLYTMGKWPRGTPVSPDLLPRAAIHARAPELSSARSVKI